MPLANALSSSISRSSSNPSSTRPASSLQDAFLANLLQGSAPGGELNREVSQGLSLSQALRRLNPSETEALAGSFGRDGLSTLASLSQETDLPLFFESLLNFASNLASQGRLEPALRIYSGLTSTDLNDVPGLSALKQRAQERLGAINGSGSNRWARAEFLSKQVLEQAFDPAGLIGMTVAGPLFRATKLVALSRLASPGGGALRSLAANLGATGLGFAAETLGFSLANRGINTLLGRPQDWSKGALAEEWALGAITLVTLRSTGNLARSGLAKKNIPLGSWSGFSASQAAMLGGIYVSRKLEEAVGLRQSPADGGTPLLDSVATLLQFNLAGMASKAIFGRSMAALETRLDQRMRGMELLSTRPLRNAASGPAPSLGWADRMRRIGKEAVLAPLWMMMGSVGNGSGPKEAGRPNPIGAAQPSVGIDPKNSRPLIRFNVKAPGVPGPRRIFPMLGAIQFIQDPITPGLRLATQEPGVWGVAANSGALVVVHGAELARQLLTDRETWLRGTGALGTPPEERPHLVRLLSPMLFMNGDDAVTRRRIMLPAASKADFMNSLTPTFIKSFEEIAGAWKPGDQVDLAQAPMRITLRNNLRGLMGLEPEMGEPIADLMRDFGGGLAEPSIAIMQKLGLKGLSFGPYADWLKKGESLRGTLLSLIEHKRANPSADALGSLVRAVDEETGQTLDTEQIIGELISFYAAGYESTARTLGWTLWLMAHHPEIGRQAGEEVASVLKGEAPTVASVRNLTYMNDVLSEAQRILPTVPFTLLRTNLREVELGGVTLPPHSNVTLSIVAQHHNPNVFSDPGIFRPSRWAEMRAAKTSLTYDFLPFGAGPRRCLGGIFAEAQLRMTLALMLQRHAFVAEPARVDSRISLVLTLEPKGELPVRIAPLGAWRKSAPPTGSITQLLYPSR